MLLTIAWRNIWRNRRRTLITATSIFFAVLFAVTIESMNRGIFDKMINDSVRFYKGYGQVSQKGYFEEGSLDLAFEWNPTLEKQLLAPEGIQGVVPRLEGFALASHQKLTKSALIIGIDPIKENQLTGLQKRLVKGSYLQDHQEALLLGEGLANKLKLTIGDTLVLLSQGYRGVNAAGKYPIQGIVSFGSPELSARMVYLPLKTAQWFFGADNLITTAILDIPNKTIANQVIPALQNSLDSSTYEVLDWKTRMPELLEMKELKQSSNVITLLILYLIVSFGIFGVILMMTKERQKEFGILLSIGMKRGQLALITWLETLFLGLIGAIIGLAVAYGLMYYLSVNPIVVSGDMAATYAKFGIEPKLPASVDADLFYKQALIVLCITTLLALYPSIIIWRMRPVEGMRA